MKIHEMYDFTGKFSLVRGFSKIKTFKTQKSKRKLSRNFCTNFVKTKYYPNRYFENLRSHSKS